MNEPYGQPPNPYDPTQFAPMNRPMPPGPGGHLPPSWPPGPPGPPPRGNRRLIWLLAGLVCVLTVTAVVLTASLVGRDRHEPAQSTTSSTAAAADDQKPLPVSALEGLLPDKDVISSAVSDPAIGLVTDGEGIDSDVMVDADCQGITSVAAPVYAGSGWTAIRWQRWNSPAEPDPPKLVHQALISVATYPQAEAARTFYSKQSAAWQKCSGRNINARIPTFNDSPDQFWSVEDTNESDGVVKSTSIQEGGGGFSCHNMLTVRNNVVVRVAVCAYTDPATAAQTILNSVTQAIDAAP